jgi:Fic family protein
MKYIHELKKWPQFSWDDTALAIKLADVRHRQGRLLGRMAALGFSQRCEAVLATITVDVVKSSEIEGEILNASQVRSSVARRLGIDIAGMVATDRKVDGVVEMMLDATQRYDKPLTKLRLLGWHCMLFPDNQDRINQLKVGKWRDDKNGPMQVVSGAIGREKVHFQAPSAERVANEMKLFMAWANQRQAIDPVLKAALAHLWFVTIHPFEDGNGRIARAIADWALARADGSTERFYSMSSQIRLDRNRYYDMLQTTQTSSLDITDWVAWFLDCLARAITNAEVTLASVLGRAQFWEKHALKIVNPRQQLMLDKLLNGFEGKLSTTKWAQLTKCSQDTAQRDIQGLINQGMLVKDDAGGRSTSYSLVI